MSPVLQFTAPAAARAKQESCHDGKISRKAGAVVPLEHKPRVPVTPWPNCQMARTPVPHGLLGPWAMGLDTAVWHASCSAAQNPQQEACQTPRRAVWHGSCSGSKTHATWPFGTILAGPARPMPYGHGARAGTVLAAQQEPCQGGTGSRVGTILAAQQEPCHEPMAQDLQAQQEPCHDPGPGCQCGSGAWAPPPVAPGPPWRWQTPGGPSAAPCPEKILGVCSDFEGGVNPWHI